MAEGCGATFCRRTKTSEDGGGVSRELLITLDEGWMRPRPEDSTNMLSFRAYKAAEHHIPLVAEVLFNARASVAPSRASSRCFITSCCVKHQSGYSRNFKNEHRKQLTILNYFNCRPLPRPQNHFSLGGLMNSSKSGILSLRRSRSFGLITLFALF